MAPIREHYDSWKDFVDAAESTNPDSYLNLSRAVDHGGNNWSGAASWDEAITLARHGWDEQRDRVAFISRNIRQEIAPRMQTNYVSSYNVAGGTVSVGRMLSGNPRCMMRMDPIRTAKPGRVITILVNVGALGFVSPETIITRGTAICSLVECLTMMHHGTEIVVESTVSQMSGKMEMMTVTVRVKRANESLDMGRLMFALANPSTLRRLVFSRREQVGFVASGGYGATEHSQTVDEFHPAVHCDYMGSGKNTVEDAERWVRETLTEFGLLT
jgi:hypothetical protein